MSEVLEILENITGNKASNYVLLKPKHHSADGPRLGCHHLEVVIGYQTWGARTQNDIWKMKGDEQDRSSWVVYELPTMAKYDE